MQDLNLVIVQFDPLWQQPAENRRRLDQLLAPLRPAAAAGPGIRVQPATPPDLIILPEMFTTGFTLNAAGLAETMDGPTIGWLRGKAAEVDTAICGSLIIAEGGTYRNRLVLVLPDGTVHSYDKKHLFSYAGEDRVFTAGCSLLTLQWRGWRIRPFICYDLRFPIWMRNIGPAYDLAVVVASWPEGRASHWRSLLQARAIENQCCVAGVNRLGTDGNGVRHSGGSLVFDARGTVLTDAGSEPTLLQVTLSAAALLEWRERFPAWRDADTDLVVS